MLMSHLELMGDVVVGLAGSVEEAEVRLQKVTPDALVCETPLVDGVAADLRDFAAGIPILAITGLHVQLSDQERLTYAVVLPRPFDPPALRDAGKRLRFFAGDALDDTL